MNATIDTKDKLTESDEDRFTATLSFSVQGWLFPESKSCIEGIILDIGTSVIAENDLETRTLDAYGLEMDSPFRPLADQYIQEYDRPYLNPREFANAHPRILKGFLVKNHGGKDFFFRLTKQNTKKASGRIKLNGYNFKDCRVLFRPKDSYEGKMTPVSLDYKESELFKKPGTTEAKNPKVRGYEIPSTVID